jgi:hypothetical protein
MTIKFLKSVVHENKQRGVVALLFVCLILCALVPGAAQLRNQKRIISLRLGEAAEGSRVSIVSDTALNDYEAFRRGDRFYVKIGTADFTSLPHLRADGFEDVQVQRVGDALIISFKLEPGATARVDPGSNRLDVVFSSPNRVLRNSAGNVESNRVSPGAGSRRTAPDRGPDAAGPIPPGGFRPRVVTAVSPNANEGRASRSARSLIAPQSSSNRNSNRNGSNQSGSANTAIKTPSPGPTPKSVLTPSSSFPVLATASPSASPAASVNARPALTSAGSVNSEGRSRAVVNWISANRLATLLGALILLSLIVYLALALRGRRKNVTRVKRASIPKVGPRVQPEVKPTVQPEESSPRVRGEERSPSPVTAATSNEPSDFFRESVTDTPVAAATSQNDARVLTRPSITSPSEVADEASGAEEEREVFEL